MAQRYRGRGGRYGSASSHTNWRVEDRDAKNILRLNRPFTYSGHAPELETPVTLGCFSVDGDREFGNDRSMLRYIHDKYLPEDKKRVHLDLNKSLDDMIPYKGTPQGAFENMLRWVLNNQEQLKSDDTLQRLSVDFICTRSSLKQAMRSPYCSKTDWKVFATEFKGTMYMVHRKREFQGTSDNRPTLWGHIFEQYMKGDPDEKVNANEEYRCVLKTSFGDYSLLYAPEVDCADPELFEEDYQDMSGFVTVKCCREVAPQRMHTHKRFKLSDWWVENQLIGIPRTVVGYRNDDGIVHTLELLKTDELPEIAGNEWEPNVHFNFLMTFLKFIKNQVREDPSATYEFEFEPMVGIRCTKIGSGHLNILPSWYTEGLFNTDESDED